MIIKISFAILICLGLVRTTFADDTFMMPTACKGIPAADCQYIKTFKHHIQEGCLNQKKYKKDCLQNFCATYCATSTCPTGELESLCHIYCHNVSLDNSALDKQMHTCFTQWQKRPYAPSEIKIERIEEGEKDFDTLKQICEKRNVLFHVDGLHMASKGMIQIKDFEANVNQAIYLTKLANQVLRKIVFTPNILEIERQAKAYLEKSDQHAQYFANVTGDLKHACDALRKIIEFGHTYTKGEIGTKYPLHELSKRDVLQHMVHLINIRNQLFTLNSITLKSGGIGRIPDFMPHIERARSLSYSINRLYSYVGRAPEMTPEVEAQFQASNKIVLDFINSVHALDQRNQVLIKALAEGQTYHP